ncbi:DUF4232 domain-containing protein [Antrihabitans cavernicola]|uniref:DUF4232 domain-containing protein n=1 Tax=Antrihabitans cavernicola TaxID=2495913 RepID=UPI0016597D11|nr:DUF4232 domain-containing protein [Spelaeibacter cavernicola]
MTASLGNEGAAAGSTAFAVVFTNTGKRSCTLDGFPGVSYVQSADGQPVGAPAQRQSIAAGPVRIEPGEQASALVIAVNVQNYPAGQCNPTPVNGVRVYPPNSYDSVYLPRNGLACGLASVNSQLKIGPVVAGASGQ